MRKIIISTIILSFLFACKKEAAETSKFKMIEINNDFNRQLTAPALSDPDYDVILKAKLANLSKLKAEFPCAISVVRMTADEPTAAKMPLDCNTAYTINVKACTKTYETSLTNADAVYDSPGIHSIQIAGTMYNTARHNYSLCLTSVQETHNNCH